MKKGQGSTADEMRAEYGRSDFKKLERGKFYEKVVASSNVVVLEPRVAKAFQNSARVNQVLSSLLELAKNRHAQHHGQPGRARKPQAPVNSDVRFRTSSLSDAFDPSDATDVSVACCSCRSNVEHRTSFMKALIPASPARTAHTLRSASSPA